MPAIFVFLSDVTMLLYFYFDCPGFCRFAFPQRQFQDPVCVLCINMLGAYIIGKPKVLLNDPYERSK